MAVQHRARGVTGVRARRLTAASDQRQRHFRIASASLRSQYLLRERLLPDLDALARAGGKADVLADLLEAHRRDWLDQAWTSSTLPPRVLQSNVGAFAADAVDRAVGLLGLAAALELWSGWFESPASPLAGTIQRVASDAAGSDRIGYRRVVCCLRDAAGAAMCRSCPRLTPSNTSPSARRSHTA